MADRSAFEVGDGATAELPAADVVALHRVFCCYPDVRDLLDRSLAAARIRLRVHGPSSSGVIGRYEPSARAIANVWYRLRPRTYGGFQVYIHDVGAIDERIRAAGFRLHRREQRRVVWQLAVYTR